MTTNLTPIPEPTSPTEVAVGKRNSQTVIAARMDGGAPEWVVQRPSGSFVWRNWRDLCRELTDIRVVDVAEEPKPCECRWCVAAQRRDRMEMGGMVIAPCDEYGRTDRETVGYIKDLEASVAHLSKGVTEPGPWLRGDELKAVMPTLKAGDVVEAGFKGRKASGELHDAGVGSLKLWSTVVRHSDGTPGLFVDALRIIERAPEPALEPGADIPDEVVEAALLSIESSTCARLAEESAAAMHVVRAALAAADAKRAELAGGVA